MPLDKDTDQARDHAYEAYERGDYEVAVAEVRPLAEGGHAWAQYNLATMYEAGLGVEEDIGSAVHWYRKAAEQGDAPAQYNMAQTYSEGLGVTQYHVEAARWYRLAAEQGHPDAQCSLGLMLHKGHGVERDVVQARAWALLAAEVGDEDAPEMIENLAREMSLEQITEAEQVAEELRAKIKVAE